MEPRGIRNNNPGNVRLSRDSWQGEVHPGTDPAFMQFTTMPYGVRCTAKILLNYQKHGFNTLTEMINRWAPPAENDTGAYLRAVSAETNMDPIKTVVLNRGTLQDLCKAIFRNENGGDFVSDQDIFNGVNLALGNQ